MEAKSLKCDVVVAGSGFGGLSTAILLSRMGLRVILVEAEKVVGGYLRSYMREGIECPVGVHYFGSADKHEMLGQFFDVLGIRDELKLKRIGQSGYIDRYDFEDWSFKLPSTVDAMDRQLRELMPDHQQGVDFVVNLLRQTIDGLRIDTGGKPASGSMGASGLSRSAADFLNDNGCPYKMHQIMSVQGFWTGTELVACPLQFPFMAMGSLLMSAWELGCTGAHMADALGAQCKARGAQVITGDRAEEILIQGNKACGVRLKSGTTIHADYVVSGMHPKTTLAMVPEKGLPKPYIDGIMKLNETPGSFGIIALLDAERHPAIPHNILRVTKAGLPGMDGLFMQLKPSGKPGLNRLLVMGKSDYDDWKPWHDTFTGKRGPEYVAAKQAMAKKYLDIAAEHIGKIQDPHILDIWSPLSARDWVNVPGGGAYGLQHSLRDGLEYMVLARTPLDRLFLVGQSVIAPGLLGVSLSVLRVCGSLVGRAKFADFMAGALKEAGGSAS